MEQELTLTRDDDGFFGIFTGEPYKDKWGDWECDDSMIEADKFTAESFRLIFGCLPLRKGRKRKIKRILIELED